MKNKDSLTSFFRSLDGVFAMVIVDEERKRILVGRDPYGVRPLYGGVKFAYKHEQANTFTVGTETMFFASEIKALIPLCDHIAPFTSRKLSSDRYCF
jgi:asparagine synthase (glutamine-hydrolysing)